MSTPIGMKRTTHRKPLKKRVPKLYVLDDLYNKCIKYLADYTCELCGVRPTNSKNFHTHHYITRTVQRLRWEPRNTICVCSACHSDLEKDPKFNVEVFTKRLGSDGVDKLRMQINTAPKADRVALKVEYQAKLKELEG